MSTKSKLFSGRYLFHFHTERTDGKLALEDYLSFAAAHGIERLILLEHIRAHPTYDVSQLALDIGRLSQAQQTQALLGFEVKLLPGGALDIAPEHLDLASVIGIAEHGFPADVPLLQASLPRALDRYRALAPDKTFVWVHPGTTFRKAGLRPEENDAYLSLLRWACQEGLMIERNLRYGLVPESTIKVLGLQDVRAGRRRPHVS